MTDLGPLVSVVIPCYGQAHHLAGAVASALAQTHRPIEVIVVDDGSPDDVAGALVSFGTSVSLVRQANQGVSAARNAGVGASSGQYVVFLDADDELSDDAVARRLAIMTARPEVGLVVGHHREMDVEGHLLARVPEHRSLPPDPFYAMVARSFPPVGWMVRRDVFDACGGFDVELANCEDWDLSIRIAADHDVGYDGLSSQRYRVDPTSASANLGAHFRASRRMLTKNRPLATNRRRYAAARWLAGFYQARFLLGRIRMLPTWTERSRAAYHSTLVAPTFALYALVVVATAPIWGRRVGMNRARANQYEPPRFDATESASR